MKQEITSKEFSSLRTVKGTIHLAYSAGVCCHLLHCQTEPQFSEKAPRKNIEVEEGPVIPRLLAK